MIKESPHQEEIIIVNIHAPNIKAPKYIKQITDLKRVIGSSMLILEDAIQYLTFISEQIRQKKKTVRKLTGLEVHFKLNGPNGHIQNISSNNNRVHFLLKHTWNTFQNGAYVVRSQNLALAN